MPCHHVYAPQPEMGGYILREVHDGRPDGILAAHTEAEEALISAAAAILAVQGYACRLVRIADEARFACQEQAYREGVLPPQIPGLSPLSGETSAQLAGRMIARLRSEAK